MIKVGPSYIHVAQSSALICLTQLIMWINGVNSFRCKNWSRSINQTYILIAACYHISLLYLDCNLFLYYRFMLSILHSYIHAYFARTTIVQSNKYTFDELWHFIDQFGSFCYMWVHDVEYTWVYGVCLITYLLLISLIRFNLKFNRILYYLGSFMAAFFIFSIKPYYNPVYLVFFIISYVTAVNIITYDNWLGRRLILLNIAGNTFIAADILLYLHYNHIYDSILI